MLSLIAANERAAVAAALGSMPLANPQIGGHFFATAGQQLPLASSGFGGERIAGLALNLLPSAAGYNDSGVDGTQRPSAQAAFTVQGAMEQDSISCGEDDGNNRGCFNNGSIDEMEDDESYLSIPGEERFALFRQMAISGKSANKICRVCGDRALGYNFNVVSCESCKAFFRRNALKKKEFRCPFDDNCDVTALSRRFCQKCRLRKCFEVGMKKEWIMSEEQRIQKRKRIEENRKKRRTGLEKRKLSTDNSQQEEKSTEEPSSTEDAAPDHQQNMTNAGFSPGSNPPTPVLTALGNDFSPPDSNCPPNSEHKSHSDAQTRIPSTIIASPKSSHVESGFRPPVIAKPVLELTLEHPKQHDGSSVRNFGSATAENSFLGGFVDASKRPPGTPSDRNSAMFPNTPRQIVTSFGSQYGFGMGSLTGYSGLPLGVSGFQKTSSVEDSSITIPKAVLINLINQCHRKQREYFNMPPPVVARAHRLVNDYGMNSEKELYKCICRCTCGAKVAGSCIGPKLVDRGIGPDGDEYMEENENTSVEIIEPELDPCGCERAKTTSPTSNLEIVEPHRSSVAPANNPYGLTDLEELKLHELFFANQVMNEESEEDCAPKVVAGSPSSSQEDPIIGKDNGDSTAQMDPSDVIHMTDVCVRRIIKMCKRLSAFKSLCQEDQIALLKGSCTELMILRGVMTFIPSKECWRPVGWKHSLLSLDVMKSVKGNVYEEHKKYLHSFRDEWRTCDAIMLCLAAITLFDPDRPNIVHIDAVRTERETYTNLLKKYLDLVYGAGSSTSEGALEELLGRVTAVGRLNDYAATIFVDVNPRDVEPLLIEIFDLK